MQDARDNTRNRSSRRTSARGRLAWATALLVAASAIAAEPSGEPAMKDAASEVTVRLHPAALVTGDRVLLSDIAEIDPAVRDLAGQWVISNSPRPGATLTLDLARVQSVLSRRGANLSRWVFRGPTECQVSRPGGASDARRAQPGTDGAAASASAPSAEDIVPAHPATLETAIRDYLNERLAGTGCKAVARFNPSIAKLLALSGDTYSFRIVSRSAQQFGLVRLEVTISENDAIRQVQEILVDVSVSREVVVARRALNRGETLNAADLRMEERVFEKPADIGLTDIGAAAGQRARQFIQHGNMLSARDLEPVPLVERNDLVTVWVHRGTLVIKTSGTAMGSGVYGDTVEVRNEKSRQSFYGVIAGPRTVEVGALRGAVATLAARENQP